MLVRMSMLPTMVVRVRSAAPLVRMREGRLGAHVVDKWNTHRRGARRC